MKKFKIYIILITICLPTLLAGQHGMLRINEILIEGISKNDSTYLQNFVSINENDPLNIIALEATRQQLIRRSGIANATYTIDTLSDQSVNVRFQVDEQKTLRPQLGIGGLKGNFWWQVGAAEYNLGGKEKTLIATYLQNDKQPNFQIFYQNARINGKKWGYLVDINRQSSIEPLFFPESTVEYLYANIGAGISAMYHPNFNSRLTVGASLFRENYEKNNPADIGTSEGPDDLIENKFLIKLQYENTRVLYDYFYRDGFQWLGRVQSVNSIDLYSQFYEVAFEGIHYWRPHSKGNIAARLRAAIATNNASPFAPFVLDSNVNLRGVGNRVDRGTAQLILNLEYRHTVFHNEKFAGQVVTFLDFGTWRNPGAELDQLFDADQFREFIGLGVRFINKKVIQSTLRLDYGIDLTNSQQRGFVFGVGQYF